MRFRIYAESDGWVEHAPDDGDYDRKPLVHAFRDDELVELVAAMRDAAAGAAITYGTGQAEHDAMLDVLRNHGTGA